MYIANEIILFHPVITIKILPVFTCFIFSGRWFIKVQHFINYYEVLQVSPNASQEIIEAAYKRLAKMYHPDVGGNEQKMKLLNEAYEVLSNPINRKAYDEKYYEELGSNKFSSSQSFTYENPHESHNQSDSTNNIPNKKVIYSCSWGAAVFSVIYLLAMRVYKNYRASIWLLIMVVGIFLKASKNSWSEIGGLLNFIS
ncbi:J domain-containing protein [Moorella naiadis]|uniref:J domain-containing protein n=1 Tax=Moorella naiadis (nom. illeg.) TaxID=3093670 RepID=UPI003D9C9C86